MSVDISDSFIIVIYPFHTAVFTDTINKLMLVLYFLLLARKSLGIDISVLVTEIEAKVLYSESQFREGLLSDGDKSGIHDRNISLYLIHII